MNRKERCPMCGGEKAEGLTTFTVDYSQGILVVRNVPALLCSQCGEEWLNDNTAEKLEHFVKEAKATKKQIEVMDFRLSVAA